MTKSVDLCPSIVIFSKVDEHDPGIRLAQATNFGLRSDMSTSVFIDRLMVKPGKVFIFESTICKR